MQTHQTHRSSLFLFELMIAILFFILSATVCICLFVKSHTLESENIDRNHAVSSAISVAEIIRTQSDPYSLLKKEYPLGSCSDSEYLIYYDASWSPCSASESVFILELHTTQSDNFFVGFIDLYKDNDILYSLSIKKYLGEEASL